MLLIITSNSDELFSGVNIDDLNDLKPQKYMVLCFFGKILWLRRMHISRVNCDEMSEDKTRQPANRNC